MMEYLFLLINTSICSMLPKSKAYRPTLFNISHTKWWQHLLKTYPLQREIFKNLMIEKFPIEIFTACFIYLTSVAFHSVPGTLDTSDTGKDKTDKVTALTGEGQGNEGPGNYSQTSGWEDSVGVRVWVTAADRTEVTCEASGVQPPSFKSCLHPLLAR